MHPTFTIRVAASMGQRNTCRKLVGLRPESQRLSRPLISSAARSSFSTSLGAPLPGIRQMWLQHCVRVGVVALLGGICASGCSESPEVQFLSAVTRNDLEAVERILDTGGVEVNFRTEVTGQTALGSACGLGRVEIVRLLLSRGADPNIANSTGMTPLQRAAYDGSTEL